MNKLKRSYIREILDATNEETISFAGGLPNEKLFPLTQLKKATNKVLKSADALQYSKSIGDESLRKKIAKIYNEKFDFPTNENEILITTGSQQSFDMISKTFIHKELFVQKPTYIGALGAFKILNKSLNDFSDVQSLKTKISTDDTLYLMSDFSNPTSISMSQKERLIFASLLKQSDSYLIEDGAYSLLSFNGKIKKPISSLYEKSFHLGSFSKIVAPGLRVGWIRTSKENIEKLLIAKESLDLHTSTLNQMIINQYLEDNDLFEHIKLIRKDYKSKMQYMASCMKKYLPSFKFEKSKGGMFIYGKFEVDSLELAKKALEKNVAFVPSCVFDVNEEKSTYARFNFTNSSKSQIKAGIKTIAKILNKE
ncbi:MAG: PLP-dependent aminotransferase family protein [Campylobacteraceae bacterium]|nr:PLP-dependent aminotransferase family protein [Campylobacteraceae bacterium]